MYRYLDKIRYKIPRQCYLLLHFKYFNVEDVYGYYVTNIKTYLKIINIDRYE